MALFAGDNDVIANVGAAGEVFISNVVLGELYYGARKSARSIENVARLDEFAAENTVLVSDTDTARIFGSFKAMLRTAG